MKKKLAEIAAAKGGRRCRKLVFGTIPDQILMFS